MMFLSIITSRLAGPVATAVALALACFLIAGMVSTAGLKRQLAKSEKAVAALRVDLLTCRANRVTLESAIDRQSAAVVAMRDAAATKARAAEKAASDARAVAESHRRRADRLDADLAAVDRLDGLSTAAACRARGRRRLGTA